MDSTTLAIISGIGILILLMIANILMQYKRGIEMQNMKVDPAAIAGHVKVPTTADMVGALSGALTGAGISEKIGAFTNAAAQMTDATVKFNQMVATKSKRAEWGEWHLEEELKETFPNVKIRQEVKELGNLKPDAHIRTPDGKILIVDSKFVYDTYAKIQEAPDTSGVGDVGIKKLQTKFRGDVKNHVNKIRTDYVQPGKGTHEVAYMYIPSMAVYEYLIEHESATVRWAASKGVVICSPVNLMANMHMIEIVRMAQNMATLHNEILDAHLRVQKTYSEFDEEYKTLNKHITNTSNKRDEVTILKEKMGSEISGLSSIDKSIGDGSTEGSSSVEE
jgi:DNA recombination protein RmuC